jgi:hypothetical protein
MLASNEARQLAAKSALASGNTEGATYWELGLGALAERDYARAYGLFVRAEQGGAYGPRVQALTLYSLLMASNPAGTEQLLAQIASGNTAQPVEPWLAQFLSELARTR